MIYLAQIVRHNLEAMGENVAFSVSVKIYQFNRETAWRGGYEAPLKKALTLSQIKPFLLFKPSTKIQHHVLNQ